jgi:hypothetical protein
MTLEELDETLPNGLHDAQIKALTHDYKQAFLKLDVRILVGLPEDAPPDRSRYRDAVILFNRVLFCAVELPTDERSLRHQGCIWLVFNRMRADFLPVNLAKSVSSETLCNSLYILGWESEIHIAAGDVSFSWSDIGEAAAAQ